ncbi:MAG: hypothetical protein D6705_02880, partial [Deltaproteobacteria bacterium]
MQLRPYSLSVHRSSILHLLLATGLGACGGEAVDENAGTGTDSGTAGSTDGGSSSGTTSGTTGGDMFYDECPTVEDPVDVTVDFEDANTAPDLDMSTCTIDAYTYDPSAETSTVAFNCPVDDTPFSFSVVVGRSGHEALTLAPGQTVDVTVRTTLAGDGEGVEHTYLVAVYDPSTSPSRLIFAAMDDPDWSGNGDPLPPGSLQDLTVTMSEAEPCARILLDPDDGSGCPTTKEEWILEFAIDGQTAQLVAGQGAVLGAYFAALDTGASYDNPCAWVPGSVAFLVDP